ncbi:MAG: sialate O-acetylesterase, partial [Phycisphaerae bacterium]|nr:sialate O-acetylesterase [Phycisphaerae bacterium]
MFNKRISSMLCILAVMAICVSVAGAAETIEKKKLKIFILAGQSNMEGHAKIETFDYIGDDPKTAPLLKEMRGPDGKPKICERVWISYLTGSGGNSGEGFGKLTAGYGSRRNPKENGGKIGPEFTFGITMEKACDGPILIIKTAWGGKSLHTDFRPPSAGPFELSETDMANIKKRGGDVNAEQAKRKQQSGHYYRLMMDHVNHVLKDIKRVCPVYDEQAGYEIAGFAWFQGWNDLVNRGVYPNRDKKGGYDLYSELMAKFIRDVRKDLKTPGMPFVIGVIGVNGPIENVDERYRAIHGNLREAMAAPAELDEFKGNVLAVRTAPFWDMPIDRAMVKRDHYNGQVNQLKKKAKNGEWTAAKLAAELKKIEGQSPTDKELAIIKRGASNAGYHYLGCGKTMALIGKAFAEGLISMKAQSITIQKGNVFGYTSVGKDRVDESYNAGFSMYAAAWPLMKEYPGHSFQSGLFGTWMFAQNDKPVPADVKLYSDIEGGLGWWRDTEYPTETPKFIMGGVELNFRGWANGPGAGQGRNWNNPKGKYGIAQLSPWVLWPPDGLNLKQGTCGELFGYGYLPLPLT